MRHTAPLLCRSVLLLSCTGLLAQSSGTPGTPGPAAQQPTEAAPPTATLHTGTQLVVVDVIVQDASGKPVHNLKQNEFILQDSKQPQTIRHFEEHSRDAAAAAAGPALPKLPPGTFTDYTPTPPSGALNILLVDSLNTPMKDQMYLRQQLAQYVKKAPADARIAIFGLSSRLFMLQGFTSDPTLLKEAVDHKLIARSSVLLDDPTGSNVDNESLSDIAAQDPNLTQLQSNLAQFEAEQQAFQTQLRIQYTIDAFNTLGHYLSNFPGRKNLIWFSGAFPIDILPDPSIDNAFATMYTNDDTFHEMTNLLARAQVAVYPVDARGLMVAPMFDAANSGRSYVRNPQAFGNALGKFNQSQAQEHSTMEQLAEDTGGHAYYNTNGLAQAVANALDSGANYYTLAYSPTNHKWDGAWRPIKVDLRPELLRAGYKLSYRHGYYADDPEAPSKPSHPVESAATTVAAANARNSALTYDRISMARGAPTPSDILFKVRVLPDSTTTEDNLAPGNQTDPQHPLKGPFRRMDVDFAALSQDFVLTPDGKGNHKGAIEFRAFVYDADGKLLNAMGNTLDLDLPPETYKRFRANPIQFHLQVSVPAKKESYLRLAIHDGVSNRFGVVEVPSSSVLRLSPPVYPTAPPPKPAALAPAQPASPQSAAPQPATPAATTPAAQPKP